MFTTESALVKIWARNVIPNGTYGRDQVPKLSNLREMVFLLLDSQQEEDIPAEEQVDDTLDEPVNTDDNQ